MIESDVLDKLVAIGRSDPDSEQVASLLEQIKHKDEVNRLHWAEWDSLTRTMTTEDVAALAKGLGLAESRLRWLGGSVAAVIWVFRELQRRDPGTAEAVAEWIGTQWVEAGYENDWVHFPGAQELRHRREIREARKENDSIEDELKRGWDALPWEKHKHEWLVREREESRVRQERQRQDDERRARERSLADELKKLKSEYSSLTKQLNRMRHAEDRRRLLQEAEHMSSPERLRLIAERDFDIGFYPEEWAHVEAQLLTSLSQEVRQKLIDKLRERKKGPWKSLVDRLIRLAE